MVVLLEVTVVVVVAEVSHLVTGPALALVHHHLPPNFSFPVVVMAVEAAAVDVVDVVRKALRLE